MINDIVERLRLYAQQFEDQHAPDEITLAMRAGADEIERLRAGGCARDQGTTQYCAEAAKKDAEIASLLNALADARTESMKLRAALEEAIEFVDQAEMALTPRGEAYVARWRAAIDGQPAPSGWRPIETAPREPGKYLLGWNGHHCGVIQYWERKYEEDPEWVDEHTEFIDPPISHWMPLPPAPKTEET